MAGHYITRAQWKARPPRDITPMKKPAREVVIHHSTTPLLLDGAQACRNVQNFHMDTQGWSDIAYQELVHANGDVYEGRGFDVQGGATKGYNSTSLAICALGNFDTTIPPAALITSIANRIVAAAQERRLTVDFGIVAHRDRNATECCGDYLYERLPEIRARVAASLHPAPTPTPLPPTPS
jgi:N-acetylmuramoyl-L-alanine amidase